METKATFRCLRCGNEFQEPFDPKAPLVERACPKCKSNSVRRLKKPAGTKA
jgi:DNA-directed RNA polymerase subunit RPC12/RpoP